MCKHSEHSLIFVCDAAFTPAALRISCSSWVHVSPAAGSTHTHTHILSYGYCVQTLAYNACTLIHMHTHTSLSLSHTPHTPAAVLMNESLITVLTLGLTALSPDRVWVGGVGDFSCCQHRTHTHTQLINRLCALPLTLAVRHTYTLKPTHTEAARW